MSVLASMIVKATKKQLDFEALSTIYATVCEECPPAEAPREFLVQKIGRDLDLLSNREIGIKYDALKNKGLI